MRRELGIYSKDATKKVILGAIRDLTEDEYKEYEKANNEIGFLLTSQDLFSILFQNFEEYKSLFEFYSNEYNKNPNIGMFLLAEIKTELNRRIVNYLTSGRMFTDHIEANIKSNYGEESEQWKIFKGICNKVYDENFSYRFIYKLRDFVQHCGLPIDHIKCSSKVVNLQTREEKHSLQINFDRDSLLQKRSFWEKIYQEMCELPKVFNVHDIIAKSMENYIKINLNFVEENLCIFEKNATIVQKLISEAKLAAKEKGIDGIICILNGRPLINEKKQNLNIGWIHLDLIDILTDSKSVS